MYQDFTEKSLKVIALAQDESRRTGHSAIECEHILLGLILEGTGIAAKTLKHIGVQLADVQLQTKTTTRRGWGPDGKELTLSANSIAVLKRAWIESRILNHNYIGPEHLLLGLCSRDNGVLPNENRANMILERLEVEPAKISEHIIRMLGCADTNVSARAQTIACPNCAEVVLTTATVCHYCQYGISEEDFINCGMCRERIRKDATQCRYCFARW